MNIRKVAGAFLLVAVFSLPGHAGDVREYRGTVPWGSPGEKLFSALASRLDPDAMEMILDEEPSPDGRIRHMYINVKGARIGGFRLDELSLETAFSRFNPVLQWMDPESVVLEEIMSGNLSAAVLEKDINSALKEHVDDNWQSVKVEISPEGLSARGYYVVRGSVSLKILVELSTGLEVRGKKVWLKDYTLSVNNAEKTDLVRDAVKDLQPLVDMEDFVFPVNVDRIETAKGSVRLFTRTAPRPFGGIRYLYQR
jgi:hypothetical protein